MFRSGKRLYLPHFYAEILPMPSTVYTGTATGGHYEPMEYLYTLVMVTSRLKSRPVSVRAALCPQCFSIFF